MAYLNKVRQTLESLVAQVENHFDIKVGEIPLRTYEQFLADITEEYKAEAKKPETVAEKAKYWIGEKAKKLAAKTHLKGNFFEYKGRIYVNQDRQIKDKNELKRILMHEAGHAAARKLNPAFEDYDPVKEKHLIYLSEGFADYLSIDFLFELSKDDESMKKHLQKTANKKHDMIYRCKFTAMKHDEFAKSHCMGYEFMYKLHQLKGKEGVIAAMKNPPSMAELEEPYLRGILKCQK